MNTIQENLAEYDVTLNYDELSLEGFAFWKIDGVVSNLELRTTALNSKFNLKIPEVKITDNIEINGNGTAQITLSKEIPIDIDIHPITAQKLDLENHYQIKLHTPKEMEINIHLNKILSSNNPVASVQSELRDIIVKLGSSNSLAQICRCDSLDLTYKNVEDANSSNAEISGEDSYHAIKINGLSVYLSEKLMKKISSKDFSNEVLNNINLEISLKKNSTYKKDREDKGYDISYDGQFIALNKIFDFIVDGKHTVNYVNGQKENNKSFLQFKIRNFEAFLNNIFTIFSSVIRASNDTVDGEKIEKLLNVTKKTLIENSKHLDENTLFFTLRDEENGIKFLDKPIEIVISPLLKEIKEFKNEDI